MSKITQKEYKQEFMEIKKYFGLDFFGTIENKNSIDTKWGLYKFYFDKNSIFGKFEDLKVDIIPDKFQEQMENVLKLFIILTYTVGK